MSIQYEGKTTAEVLPFCVVNLDVTSVLCDTTYAERNRVNEFCRDCVRSIDDVVNVFVAGSVNVNGKS